MTFLGTFGFCKRCQNLDIFDREPKNACALFACVLWFYVFSWIIFHTFDIDMLQMSFAHEETLIWGYTCNVCGKKFKIKWYMEKTFEKKAHTIFWFPMKDIKISDNFDKILNFPRTSWASVITHKDLLHLIIWMYTTPSGKFW